MYLFMAGETAVESTPWWEKALLWLKDAVTTPLFGENKSQTLLDVCKNIIIALIVLIIGCIIVKKIVKNIENGKIFKRVNKTVRMFLRHLIAVVLYAAVAIAVVAVLGFDMSALSALIASCGLTVGLALQGGLSNIAGGIMLVVFKPFEIGDFVESSGVSGTVVDIGLFYSTLTTPSNEKVVVPNGTISNNVIVNYSAHETRRIDFDFSIAYSADIDTARKVLYACAKADEKILTDPEPVVLIASHNDSSITIKLRVWVKNADYWDVYFPMFEQVKRGFEEYGVEIPYPHLNVTIDR